MSSQSEPTSLQGSPSDTPLPRYAFIDALRGWAFLLVLAVHVSPRVSPPAWLAKLSQQGNYGVQLFFVVSALTLLISLHARHGRDKRPVAAFLVRRLARILPMFWVAIAFYTWHKGLGPRSTAPQGIGWPHVLATMLFVHGAHPTTINSVVPGGWSIAVEMNFYLLVPSLFRWITTMRRSLVAVGASLVGSIAVSTLAARALRVRFPELGDPLIANFTYYWLPRQIAIFALGFVLYFAIVGTRPSWMRASVLWVLAPLGALAAMLIWGTALPAAYYVFSAVLTTLAWSLSWNRFPLLVNPVTRYIGEVSFSAYLAHFFVIDVLVDPILRLTTNADHTEHVTAYLALYCASAMGTVFLATLTYRTIERPGQALGQRIVRHFLS